MVDVYPRTDLSPEDIQDIEELREYGNLRPPSKSAFSMEVDEAKFGQYESEKFGLYNATKQSVDRTYEPNFGRLLEGMENNAASLSRSHQSHHRKEPRGCILDGTIKKKCPMFPLLWQSRYFILNQEGLVYYYGSVSCPFQFSLLS